MKVDRLIVFIPMVTEHATLDRRETTMSNHENNSEKESLKNKPVTIVYFSKQCTSKFSVVHKGKKRFQPKVLHELLKLMKLQKENHILRVYCPHVSWPICCAEAI